jgi:ubiquinone/menaquinone biosynthesis C-methylase UbiE
MKDWDNFYGSLTTGAGTILTNDTFFSYSEKAINLYKKSILKNLKITKIPINNNYDILDVGTGRQALAFSKISNGNIDHIDLSHTHVQRTKKTAKRLKIKNINSIQKNLDNYKKFKKETYDLIYLQGIIQHFKNPQTTLENILSSLKVGGYAWLYIYKSGTYRQYVDHLIRNSIKNILKKSPSIKDAQKIKKFIPGN